MYYSPLGHLGWSGLNQRRRDQKGHSDGLFRGDQLHLHGDVIVLGPGDANVSSGHPSQPDKQLPQKNEEAG